MTLKMLPTAVSLLPPGSASRLIQREGNSEALNLLAARLRGIFKCKELVSIIIIRSLTP